MNQSIPEDPATAAPKSLPAASRNSWQKQVLVYFAVLLLVVLFQTLQGAYRSEFGGHPDEAGHCVTGLFIKDAIGAELGWVFGGLKGSPVKLGKEFAEAYYTAYPKIGLGIWPPFFYGVQSAWTTVIGSSRVSLLLLMAALTAALGLMLFKSLREEVDDWTALLALPIFVSLPLIQNYSAMIMAEILSGCLMFAAALWLGRFLDGRRTADALGFGLLASLAILTKGTGLALALTGLIALGLTRRWGLLRSPALWGAGLMVAVLAGPWTWFFRNTGKGGWEEPSPSWHFTKAAFPYYLWKLAIVLGILLLGLALCGIVAKLCRRGPISGKWASLAGLVLSVCVFQSIAPAGREARHLLPAVPAMILFAVAGLDWLLRLIPGTRGSQSRWMAASALLVLYFLPGFLPENRPLGFGSVGDRLAFSPFSVREKGYSGFGEVARQFVAENPGKQSLMVSSDARGEGMLIAEVALRDSKRPGFVVQRASKLLAASTWGGGSYQNYYEDEQGLIKALLDSGVDYVAIDCAVPQTYRKPHHEMLAKLVLEHPEIFKPLGSYPLFREGVPCEPPIRFCRILRANSQTGEN